MCVVTVDTQSGSTQIRTATLLMFMVLPIESHFSYFWCWGGGGGGGGGGGDVMCMFDFSQATIIKFNLLIPAEKIVKKMF